MGKVKTDMIKRLAKELIKRFPEKFSSNFDDNKHMVSKLTQGATTRVRNQVAGYITRTCKLNQQGVPVQEEEPLEQGTEEA